jgi:hypothetical protein
MSTDNDGIVETNDKLAIKCTQVTLTKGLEPCGGTVGKDGRCTTCNNIAKLAQYHYELLQRQDGMFSLLDKTSNISILFFNKLSDSNQNKIKKITKLPDLVISTAIAELEQQINLLAYNPKDTPHEVEPSQNEKDMAMKIVKSPQLFYHIKEFFKKGFYIDEIKHYRWITGEEDTSLLVTVLAIQIAIRTKTGIVWLTGTPATGKDTIVRLVLAISPIKYSGQTHQTLGALRYGQTQETIELDYVSDVQKFEGESARELRHLRDGDAGSITSYATPNRENGEMDVRTVKTKTPKIYTVNDLTEDGAVLSGSINIEMDESEEQTRRVKEEEYAVERGEHMFTSKVEQIVMKEVFRIICREDLPDPDKQIIIPYALSEICGELFSSKATDSRRDIPKFFEIVKTIHWMRRHQLPKEQWYICDWVDFYLACKIAGKAIQSTMPELKENEINVLHALKYYHDNASDFKKDGGATAKMITDSGWCSKLQQPTVKNILRGLLKKGYCTLDKGNGQFTYYLHSNYWHSFVSVSPISPELLNKLTLMVINHSTEKLAKQEVPFFTVDPISGCIVDVVYNNNQYTLQIKTEKESQAKTELFSGVLSDHVIELKMPKEPQVAHRCDSVELIEAKEDATLDEGTEGFLSEEESEIIHIPTKEEILEKAKEMMKQTTIERDSISKT